MTEVTEFVVQDGDEFDSRKGADFFKSKAGVWGYTPTETGHDGKPTPCNGELFVIGFETRESAAQHAFDAWVESERDSGIDD